MRVYDEIFSHLRGWQRVLTIPLPYLQGTAMCYCTYTTYVLSKFFVGYA